MRLTVMGSESWEHPCKSQSLRLLLSTAGAKRDQRPRILANLDEISSDKAYPGLMLTCARRLCSFSFPSLPGETLWSRAKASITNILATSSNLELLMTPQPAPTAELCSFCPIPALSFPYNCVCFPSTFPFWSYVFILTFFLSRKNKIFPF
jgi:hypothetical protein